MSVQKVSPTNMKVPSLTMVDFSDMQFPMIVVYDSPLDFPNKVIARIWEGVSNQPTNVYCEYETLAKCQKDISDAEFNIYMPRVAMDNKCIVGTYMR